MRERFTILLGDGAWRVMGVRDGCARQAGQVDASDAPPSDRAQAVHRLLADAGCVPGEPLMLALPSHWCLCAAVSTDGLERSGRRKSLAFRLEEHVPLSAEDAVADFVELPGRRALGVCAEPARLREIVDAFEALGYAVRHLCPAALLAAQHAEDAQPGDAVVMMEGADRPATAPTCVDVVELADGRPVAWAWHTDTATGLRPILDALHARRVVVVGRGHVSAELLPGGDNLVDLSVESVDHAAALTGAAVLDEASRPWIDLRRDALAAPGRLDVYRRPVIALAAALALMLLCICAASVVRGSRYADTAARARADQVDLFKAAFPEQRVPVSVRGRLLSERQRLSALGGEALASDAGGDGATHASALEHLRLVLGSLPTDLRYRVLDVSIGPDLIRIDGQARSHAEAERLTVAVRELGLYEVEPAKTQALRDKGVSFVFTARPVAPKQAKGGGR